MIYPNNFEEKIQFSKIRKIISAFCQSKLGKKLVEDMNFMTRAQNIIESLDETQEFMNILQAEDFPDVHFEDVRSSLLKIKIEGMFLEIAEMVQLKKSLDILHAVIRFFKDKNDQYPVLTRKSGSIKLFPYILKRFDAIVSKHGTIKDTASDELRNIRRSILSKQSSISRRINAILQKVQSEGWADKDSAISIRDGRMVVPIPSAYKRKISGIIHDESATGKTSYIEPSEIVEINNDIRELEINEKREVMRILKTFADDIRPYIDDILPAYDYLAYIDFIKAKAKFAISIIASVPKLSEKPEMEWFTAKHPLLYLSLKKTGKKVVPLDIKLDRNQRIVIISGPNAGGKSVCLQTIGLLQYMLQCGIPVSCGDNSNFGIFKNILIDMGDEQSIENDLSTYSSHLLNMKNFLKYGNENSLILIDEFGTGTEPNLGGAIAEAVLKSLNQKKVKGIITTHYANLKLFASETSGIENGAMLYDNNKMSPLFEFRIGKPGSSFAFEIAKKIGLPKDILEDASSKIGQEQIDYDKHLKDIARDKRYWEEKRRKIHENEKRLDKIVDKYNNELEETSSLRKEIISKAKKEAEEIISSANKTIEQTIKSIRENQAEKEKTRELRKELEDQRNKLLVEKYEEEEKLQRKIQLLQQRQNRKKDKQNKEKNKKELSSIQTFKNDKARINSFQNKGKENDSTLRSGDFVYLPNNKIGEVLKVDAKNAIIALGNLKTIVKTSSLRKLSTSETKKVIKNKPQVKSSNYVDTMMSKRSNFKTEIDVRGLRAEEAIQRVTELIDEAVVLNTKQLRVLHGTGTGALRYSIRQFLLSNPIVADAKDEQVQLGGAGITIIDLDI